MRIISCMSGTSLDGLDIAFCEFSSSNHNIEYKILNSKTIDYSKEWKSRFESATELSGLDLSILDHEFGVLTGNYINQFIQENNITDIDFIASHGHTIFHQPERQFTLQIGNGVKIASLTNIPVINDFRSLDVSLNGQGAPLVPVGDKLLFRGYDYCLNLGGFSNVSYQYKDTRIAFDISPVNIVLNHFAEKLGLAYDNAGNLGRKGKVIDALLEQLNQLDYYSSAHPKSLGKEWISKTFLPIIYEKEYPIYNILRTIYEHISFQIGRILSSPNSRTLVTGGGVFNSFLMELIEKKSTSEIVIPSPEIINYKEALIFGLLAYLRAENKTNILKSVTGASRDSCSGNIIYP